MENIDIEALKDKIDALQEELAMLKEQNGAASSASINEQFDALKAEFLKKFDQGDALVAQVEEEIKTHPLKAVGIAAIIGYLISKIVHIRA